MVLSVALFLRSVVENLTILNSVIFLQATRGGLANEEPYPGAQLRFSSFIPYSIEYNEVAKS